MPKLSHRVRIDDPTDLQQRRSVERELRRRGLPSLATRATLRDSAAFALPPLRGLLLYIAVAVLLLSSWVIPEDVNIQIYPERDFLYLIDFFSGMTGATCIFVTLFIARRDGRRAAAPALCGLVLFLIPALSAPAVFTPIHPEAIFGAFQHGHLTAALAAIGLAGPVDLAAVIQHWLVGLGIALFLIVGVLSGAFASAIQVVRTVFFQLLASFRDVIAAVPALVVALFFFLLLSDVWFAVGTLSSARLLAVLLLLGLLSTVFVIDITRREVAMLVASRAPGPTRWVAARNAHDLTPEWSDSRRMRAELWVQMGAPTLLRILLAGSFLAMLLGFAGALLTSPALLADWLHHKPHVIANVSPLGVQLLLTREGLSVALLLGAFAGLAYAATALEEGANRDRLLGHVRAELADGLALGAYYRGALNGGWWRPRPGAQWPYLRAFILEEPERRESMPLMLGEWLDDELPAPRLGPITWKASWSASWFPDSQELVVVRMTPYPTEVRLLGHFAGEQAVREAVGEIPSPDESLPFSTLSKRVNGSESCAERTLR